MNLYGMIKESTYDNDYRGDDYWELSDAYANGDLSENELAGYLLDMYDRVGAVKAFKEITDGKKFPKMEVPAGDIKEVSEEELHDFIMNWENDRTSVDNGRYIGKEGNKWVVIDNRTGDCWTEEFTNRGSALDYLNDEINADGSPYNEAEKKDPKYGIQGSPEPYIKAVADDMGVDLDSKVPFEYFYAPDSDDEDAEEYWYDENYDYADFYNRILHDMGYGESPVLNDCRAEVHEVSDGSYEMTLFYNGKEYTLDIDANDHMEQVKDNVDAIIEILGRQAVKEAEEQKGHYGVAYWPDEYAREEGFPETYSIDADSIEDAIQQVRDDFYDNGWTSIELMDPESDTKILFGIYPKEDKEEEFEEETYYKEAEKLKESVYDLPGVKCILCYYDSEKHNRPGSVWTIYSHYIPANTLKFVLNGEMMRPEEAKYYNILSLGEYEGAYREDPVLGVDKYADKAKELPPRPVKEAEENNSGIVVVSNGSKYEFGSKEEAKRFWTDCCFNSEGSEQERYLNILSAIEAGKTYVSDGSDDRVPSGKNIYKDYSDVKKKGSYKVFNGYKNPAKGDYTPKYKSYKLAGEGRLSTAEGWLQFFNGHNLARSKSTWNEFKQEMLAAGREEELNKIKEDLEKGYGVKLDEAEEEFKPNGVVDDIKKRGDGDLDVTSPLELNTGILPIVNVDQYSRQELFYDEENLMNDVNGDGSKILEPGDEGYYEITTDMIDNATMEYAPPVIEEYINSVLPGSSVKATKMYHPKYYNYGGDELEFTVTFDPAKYNELEEKTVADPEFKNYLKEHYSSYSGFISYLADNLDEFYQQDGWKRFVQVIMFNLRNEEDEMQSAEDSMWENIIGNIG